MPFHSVTSRSGDPDLYIGTKRLFPTRDNYQWRSTGSAGETIQIITGDPAACETTSAQSPATPWLPDPTGDGGDGTSAAAGCTYRIAVYAWTSNVEFSVTVTTTRGDRLLLDGSPASAKVGAGESRYFKFYVRSDESLSVALTPFSGNPSLYARFDVKPQHTDDPLTRSQQWSSTEGTGIEALTLQQDDSRYCAGAVTDCTLFL